MTDSDILILTTDTSTALAGLAGRVEDAPGDTGRPEVLELMPLAARLLDAAGDDAAGDEATAMRLWIAAADRRLGTDGAEGDMLTHIREYAFTRRAELEGGWPLEVIQGIHRAATTQHFLHVAGLVRLIQHGGAAATLGEALDALADAAGDDAARDARNGLAD